LKKQVTWLAFVVFKTRESESPTDHKRALKPNIASEISLYTSRSWWD